MLILALDTATSVCSLALTWGLTLLTQYEFAHSPRLAERLPEVAEFALADTIVAGAVQTLRDVDLFAVDLGPGATENIETAVKLVKAWALQYDKPASGISSFDAMVAKYLTSIEHAVVAATVDCGNGEVAASFYASSGVGETAKQVRTRPTVLQYADLIPAARAAAGDPEAKVILAGEVSPELQFAALGRGVVFADGGGGARALDVAGLAYVQETARFAPADLDRLRPLRFVRGDVEGIAPC